MADVLKIGSSRVWVIPYGAGPTHAPQFQQYGSLGSIDWDQGDVENIEAPSDKQYSTWEVISSFQGSAGRATSTLTMYETTASSLIMTLIRQRCDFDIQIHKGLCEDPRVFRAYQKVRVLEGARASSLSTADNGSLTGDNEDAATEELSVSANTVFDIYPMVYSEVAATYIGETVKAVVICDSVSCGGCSGAVPSDGCQKVFAVTDSAASSPGLLPQVVATGNGGTTWVERWITSATLGEAISDAVCAGDYLVVFSQAAIAMDYAAIADILLENETWAEVSTGFTKGPNAAWNYSALETFIAAEDGYVYFMEDPGSGVTALSAGSLTGDDLDAISGYDAEHVAAVGANNAFVYTTDGTTFALGTTTALGTTDLYTVAYRTEDEIWVAGDDGILYYTVNFGATWGTKSLSSSTATVRRIVWVNKTVGYAFAATVAPRGQVFKTIDGGYSWFAVPENTALTLPTADTFLSAAACDDPNVIWFGGLADNAADGILVKGSVA